MTIQAYHGSNSPPFEQFDYSKCGSGIVGSQYKNMFFLTTSRDNAEFYIDSGGHISLWELTLENPKVFENTLPCNALRDGLPLDFLPNGEPDYDNLYDAVICRDVVDGSHYSDIIVIWDHSLAKRLEVVETFPLDDN